MRKIHETAVVASGAEIDPTAEIGPFAVVEDDVHIGARTTVGPHAVVRQFSRVGCDNVIDAHTTIGGLPEHAGFDGSETWVEIGDNNVFREGVTVNRAYYPGNATRIGSGCFFMTNSHVGHDCIVGDNVIMTYAPLGGHVEVGDNAFLGGFAGAHQFVRIGAFCMVAANTILRKDAIPFTMISGEPPRHYRLNTVGLRRNGITGERYRALETAFRALRDGDKSLQHVADTQEITLLRDWLAAESKYGVYGFATAKR